MFQSARPDCGSASLNKLSKAGSDSRRSRRRNSTTHERTAVDHLFGLATDSTVTRGCGLMRSCFLTSLTDLKFISLPSLLDARCQAQVGYENNLKRMRLFKVALSLHLAWDEKRSDRGQGIASVASSPGKAFGLRFHNLLPALSCNSNKPAKNGFSLAETRASSSCVSSARHLRRQHQSANKSTLPAIRDCPVCFHSKLPGKLL
jgi:hypothetical protein